MKKITLVLSSLLIGLSSCDHKTPVKEISIQNTEQVIFPRGAKINNDNFTGTAYLEMLVNADSLNATGVGNVTFMPGARTRWHSHPGGQILLVTEGVGYYQERGKVKKTLHKGDVIKCDPKVEHWHGASRDTAFVQIAVTNSQNGPPIWLEFVSDDEYNK
jgi:quercetin dioxygenase-like cupin family protein